MPEETNTEIFYNVMPEATKSGPLKLAKKPLQEKQKVETAKEPTQPSSSVEAPKVDSKTDQKTNPISVPKSKPYTKFILIGLAVLMFAGAAGAGYYFFTKDSNDSTESLLINPEPTINENPEVTTSSEWLERFFGSSVCTEITICGDKSDPDRDGYSNIQEFEYGTDPNNPDSDNDGIADGDEANIFQTDPLLRQTYREGTYLDPDFIKGGYDINTNEVYTESRLAEIKQAIATFGLHQPTLTTLGTLSFELYNFTDPNAPQLPANLDLSPQAKLDRDSQRQSTIKKIGSALLAYQKDKKSFPPTEDFVAMSDMIKPFNTLATNYNDPISIDPYQYGYKAENNNANFTLTYYSETQNQLIKYRDSDAIKDVEADNGKVDDITRKSDVEAIASALRVYSSIQLQPESTVSNVFPDSKSYKTELVPRYITAIPVDPLTKVDYPYEVGETRETFTVRTILKNPVAGTTGYMCNQETCLPF